MKCDMTHCHGGSSVVAIFFVCLFSVLAISFTAVSNMNVQVSHNHSLMVAAQAAADSGLAYASSLFSGWSPMQTPRNSVSSAEAAQTYESFCLHVRDYHGLSIFANPECTIPWTSGNNNLYLLSRDLETDSSARFTLGMQFLIGDLDNPHRLIITSTGTNGNISRRVSIIYLIQKSAEVLEYAIASRGRMWLTGDSTIEGDVFSSWDRSDISPFNMTGDSRINGTFNTVLSLNDIETAGVFQMETLVDGQPVDIYGNPLGDNYEERYYSASDELQGYHEGVNYDAPYMDMPGMDISDYNTDDYLTGLTDIPTTAVRQEEYFPHAAGDYTQPRDGGSRYLNRYVYENETFTNCRLPSNRNAVFKNCTFEGVLYVDCYKSGSTGYNNVRFNNCNFNGVIVSNTPQVLKWQYNCLYFTGSASFNNQSAVQEATILAPHFNVNLGNTNPVEGEANVLTGAIVGGIVDIRGNAEINGTIISMCDTTAWSSGYVTNIGATLGDGGSETTEPGDIGTIHITPDPDNMLPSGIMTPIAFVRDGSSYVNF